MDSFALVTGASSGIGYCYARELASRGYGIIAVSNDEPALMEKAEVIRRDFGVSVDAVVMDLSAADAPETLYHHCRAQGYQVDFLVNNAGVYHDRDFLDDSPEFNRLILMLHVHAPAMLQYYFSGDMAQRGKGYVINMSSVTSGFGIQRMSTYSSTKAFLKMFSRSTHIELYGKGVHVTCVRPGAIATGLYDLKPFALRTGLAVGYIMRPEILARKAVRAALKGRAQITPGFFTCLLQFLVGLIPTALLRLIRKLRIF